MLERSKRRWTRRFHVFEQNVELFVELKRDPIGLRIPASIIDISLGGVQLRAYASLVVNDELKLWIKSGDGDISLEVDSYVCTAREIDRYFSVAGCRFVEPLKPGLIDRLFSLGLVERRKLKRMNVAKPAKVDWERGPRNVQALIRNFSDLGFAFEVETLGPTARPLCITVDGVLMNALKKWQVPENNNIVVGCEFRSTSDFYRMRELLAPASNMPLRVYPWMIRVARRALGLI